MNSILNKHFVYIDEGVNSKILEDFVVKKDIYNKKVLFIDAKRDAEKCLAAYSFISSRKLGNHQYIYTDDFSNLLEQVMLNDFVFAKWNSEESYSFVEILKSIIKKQITNLIFLFNVNNLECEDEQWKYLCDELYSLNNQVGICVDDVASEKCKKKTINVIFYKSAKNIEFL